MLQYWGFYGFAFFEKPNNISSGNKYFNVLPLALHISKIFCIKFSSRHTNFIDAFRKKVMVAICHNGMSFWKYVFGFLRYTACRFIRYKDSCKRLYLKYWVFDVRDPHCPIHLVTSSISYFWTSNTSYVIWCNGAFCTTLIFAAVMPSKNLKVNRG